jgi:hypothetical protein
MTDDLIIPIPDTDLTDPTAIGKAIARMCFALSDEACAETLSRRVSEIERDLMAEGASRIDASLLANGIGAAARSEWARISLGKKHYGGEA